VILWDVTDPTAPRTLGPPLHAYSGWVQTVAFGHVLVTGGWNGTVVL
jgi:hypothetical protein